MKPTRQAAQSPDERRREPPRRERAPDRERGVRKEIGGPDGPEPTRYGDWERNGRCTDF